MSDQPTLFSGVINVDKPAGKSSARVVAAVKRLLPHGTKIGHAGTLDPFATGVLLLLVGRATKMCERLMDEPKQYHAVVEFGATTETDDVDSPKTVTQSSMEVARRQIEEALSGFVGEIQQRPPAYSALKVGGRRAYALARKGHEVQLEPRTVRVDRIELLDYTWPRLTLLIDCGRGTYIRSIARDLGEILKVGGFLRALRRTRVGPFRIEQATTLETLLQSGVAPYLLDPGAMLCSE